MYYYQHEVLFFNDFYMTAVVKKIKYTLKILLKCMEGTFSQT